MGICVLREFSDKILGHRKVKLFCAVKKKLSASLSPIMPFLTDPKPTTTFRLRPVGQLIDDDDSASKSRLKFSKTTSTRFKFFFFLFFIIRSIFSINGSCDARISRGVAIRSCLSFAIHPFVS